MITYTKKQILDAFPFLSYLCYKKMWDALDKEIENNQTPEGITPNRHDAYDGKRYGKNRGKE